MGKRGNREYFKEAARKCRRKRKAAEQKLIDRNTYLEEVENPYLRDQCKKLSDELYFLSSSKTRGLVIGPFKSNDNLENEELKDELDFYRECQEEVSQFMRTMKERMRLKTQLYSIKGNFSRILNMIS